MGSCELIRYIMSFSILTYYSYVLLLDYTDSKLYGVEALRNESIGTGYKYSKNPIRSPV